MLTRSPVLDRLDELKRLDTEQPRYTRNWLANALGVDRTLLYRWLVGQRPIPELRRRQIATLLNMPLEHVRPADPLENAA